MKLSECRFLADENFDPESISHWRGRGLDVASAIEAGLIGRSDSEVLRAAHIQGRVVLTHDRDFGALAVVSREPLVGIVFIRPGHISAEFTNRTLDALSSADPDVHPPFIVVARQSDGLVSIRIRKL